MRVWYGAEIRGRTYCGGEVRFFLRRVYADGEAAVFGARNRQRAAGRILWQRSRRTLRRGDFAGDYFLKEYAALYIIRKGKPSGLPFVRIRLKDLREIGRECDADAERE